MNVNRIKGVLVSPRLEWAVISEEATTIPDLYKSYVVILAAIGPIASIIGLSIIGVSLPFVGSIRIPITTAVTSAVVNYVLTLGGVYLLSLIIDGLAPTFGGEKSMNQAFKVAVYSSVPGWLVGIFTILPALSVLGLLGLYGLYLLFVGLPVLMKSPQEKSLVYTITVVVAAIIIFVVIGMISHSFVSYPAPKVNLNLPRIN
jgi:hypothetical protein